MLYYLEELKEINVDGYLAAMKWMRENIGGSSYEALEKYARQTGIFVDEDGNIFQLMHRPKY